MRSNSRHRGKREARLRKHLRISHYVGFKSIFELQTDSNYVYKIETHYKPN